MSNSIHYKTIGHGPEVVLLHGWGWHIDIWQVLLPQLKKQYRLTLVDLPGHGKSSIFNQDYSLENIAQEILNIAPKRATWIGWSLGGLVATWIAIKYPSRLEGLILIAYTPRFLQDLHWPGIKQGAFEQFMYSLENNFNHTLKQFLVLQCYQDKSLNKKNLYLKKIFLTKQQSSLATLKQSLKLLFNMDLRLELINIKCPSLLILGELDVLIPIDVIKKIQNYMPKLQINIIPGSGHIPFLSNATLFYKKLDGFLRDIHATTI